VVVESNGSSSENAEMIGGERLDSRRDKSIGRKLLRLDARGVGPVGGGASEADRGGGFEWIGGKPFKASVDCVRLRESTGKFANTSDDTFLSRIWGAAKFLRGVSSIGAVGMSTFIEGGPRSAVRVGCDRPKDWVCEPGEGKCGRSCLGEISGLILPIDIFFKNPHLLVLSLSSFLKRRSYSSPGEEGGRGLMRDLRWGGVGGLEAVEKVEEVEEDGPAGWPSSKTVSQPVLLSRGRDLFAEIRVGLPVTPKLAKRFGGTFVSRGGDWGNVRWWFVIRRFELDREVA